MAATVSTTSVRTQTSVLATDTVGSTTTATVFGTSWTMPANALTVGRGLQVVARGIYSTAAALPGNLTLDVMGGTTVLASTGAQALTAGLANSGWEVAADIVCGTTGAAGAVEAQGLSILTTGLLTANQEFMVNTAGVSLSTTVSQAIVPRVTWSATGNTITMRLLRVDMLGAQ